MAGCTAALTDSTTSAELLTDNKGAFAVLVELPDDNCNNMLVHIGKEEGGSYHYLASIPMQSELAGHKGFVWPKPAGTYHIVGVFCGKSLTEGREIGFAGAQRKPMVSFASFEIKPGEVADIGRLTIRGSTGKRSIKVDDLPREEVKLLADRAPKLAASMVKRPMKIDVAKTNTQETEAALIVATAPPPSTMIITTVPVYRRH